MNPSIWCTVIFYNLKEFFDAGLTETGFKRLIMDKIFFYWKMGAQKSVIERHPAFTTSSFDTSFVYLGDKLNFRPPFSLDYSYADWIFPFRALWSYSLYILFYFHYTFSCIVFIEWYGFHSFFCNFRMYYTCILSC